MRVQLWFPHRPRTAFTPASSPLARSGQDEKKARVLPPSVPVKSSNQPGFGLGKRILALPRRALPSLMLHSCRSAAAALTQGPCRGRLSEARAWHLAPVLPWVTGAAPHRAASVIIRCVDGSQALSYVPVESGCTSEQWRHIVCRGRGEGLHPPT